jgi:protein phosphatase
MGATMKYVWGSATHQGMVRQNNEDSLYPDRSGESDGPAVLMVADGMGGHVAGEVASRLAINAAASSTLDPGDRVAAANRAIREEVARQPDLQGMGTTLTLVELTPEGTAKFGHVGDSRAYLFRDGELKQLTDDHTVAAEYVALGQLSVEEATGHPQSHMLTRCLGLTRFVNVDEFDLELEAGDRLLLCSDGLNLMVAPEGIVENLTGGTADEAAWKLVEVANKAGGHDNTSVIVIDVLT